MLLGRVSQHLLEVSNALGIHATQQECSSVAVPDFRSSNGLFNTLRAENKLKASGKQLFDASVYQNDASTSSFHQMVRTLSKLTDGAQATPFHHMLATLAEEGRLLRLYTQNVDGIDVDMEPLRTTIPLPKKGPWPKTIQLHGSLKKMVCAKCRELKDFDPELFEGPNPPSCTSCIDLDKIRTEEAGKRSHGIGKLRPRMVLYNEENPDAEAIGATVAADLRTRPDAIIVVGTSMEIPGVQRIVKEMCGVIRDRRDGKCIWINRGPPPTGPKFENCWDLVIAGDCDRVAEIADMRKWYEEPREGVRVTDSDAEQAKAKETDVKVVVKSPVKRAKFTPPGLLTPAPSPKLKPTKLKLNINPSKTSKNTANGSKSKSKSKKATKSMTMVADGKVTKPKPKPKPKHSTEGKITASFKTSKLQVCPPGKTQSPGDQPKPLEPLSPQSAKNNSGDFPPGRTATNLLKIEVPLEKPPQAGRLTSMRDETVSPIGRGPRAMADGAAILN